MEKPASYFDWEQTFKKKKAKKVNKPKETKIINALGLLHDFFKSYLKLWRSEHIKMSE